MSSEEGDRTMNVIFLGVGEASDERLPNTSILVQTESEQGHKSILLDCGFTVPSRYWTHMEGADELDALWISHFHGDHTFGVPALLLRFWEMKRRKPLRIVSQSGIREFVHQVMDLAYPGFLNKLTYPLEFVEMEPDRTLKVLDVEWRAAVNGHSRTDLALRIDDGAHSLFYSGDGAPTPETLLLADGCDLVIHEAYGLDSAPSGHGTIQGCIDFARKVGTSMLALVHVQRDVRRERYQEIVDLLEKVSDFHALLPEPDDVLELG